MPEDNSPKLFNQEGLGLTLRDKYDETHLLSTVSIGCLAPIFSSDHSLNGYIWVVSVITIAI